MSTLTQFLPQNPASGIKTVQAGTFTIVNGNTTGTASISSVNTAKAFLIFLGSTESNPYIYLDNATTVIAVRDGTANTRTVSYTVVEFN